LSSVNKNIYCNINESMFLAINSGPFRKVASLQGVYFDIESL